MIAFVAFNVPKYEPGVEIFGQSCWVFLMTKARPIYEIAIIPTLQYIKLSEHWDDEWVLTLSIKI